jgi:hypothetical protein
MGLRDLTLPRTRGDFGSLLVAIIFFLLPGVDRAAFYQWLVDSFGGQLAVRWGFLVISVGSNVVAFAFVYLCYYLLPYSQWLRNMRIPYPNAPFPWAKKGKVTVPTTATMAIDTIQLASTNTTQSTTKEQSEREALNAEQQASTTYQLLSPSQRSSSYSQLQVSALFYNMGFISFNIISTVMFEVALPMTTDAAKMPSRTIVACQLVAFFLLTDFGKSPHQSAAALSLSSSLSCD